MVKTCNCCRNSRVAFLVIMGPPNFYGWVVIPVIGAMQNQNEAFQDQNEPPWFHHQVLKHEESSLFSDLFHPFQGTNIANHPGSHR